MTLGNQTRKKEKKNNKKHNFSFENEQAKEKGLSSKVSPCYDRSNTKLPVDTKKNATPFYSIYIV